MRWKAARRPRAADSSQLEAAVRALSERIDHLGHADSASSMAQIEQRIAYLLRAARRHRSRAWQHLGRVEEDLSEILRHLEYQRQALAGLGENSAARRHDRSNAASSNSIRRELIDVRDSQVGKRPAHAGHARSRALDAQPRGRPPRDDRGRPAPRPVGAAAAARCRSGPRRRHFRLGRTRRLPLAEPAPHAAARAAESGDAAACRRRSRTGDAVRHVPNFAAPLRTSARPRAAAARAPRAPIDSNLPPDYPLEPGARSQRSRSARADRDLRAD